MSKERVSNNNDFSIVIYIILNANRRSLKDVNTELIL